VAEDALDAAIRAVLADGAAGGARGFFLLARAGQPGAGEAVGVAYVARTWTLEHGGPTAWLEELYVEAAHRNRGIGGALLDGVLAAARERGCAAVDLEVERDHARAENLYRRAGFSPLARSRWVRRLAPDEAVGARDPDIWVDADACPVKAEVYRVALRYDLRVFLVANAWLRPPREGRVETVVVEGDLDAADDWIAERVVVNDIVITADVPLAARCLQKGVAVIGPRGRPFTEDSIGEALASRELLSQLREAGEVTGGPAPLGKKDRSRFLQRLDEAVQAARRRPA
jgi:uncharacterized protein YaiI (UPF0178 family)/GNAT superfamily N-acetyltransferase